MLPHPPRFAARLISFSAVLVVLMASLGSGPTSVQARNNAVGPNGQGTLLFVGDSLTVGANAFGSLPTRVRATGTWTQVLMDARDGRTASQGATVVKQRNTRKTTAIVVALGTNDMISKPETWYPSWVIDKVMAQSQGKPVLWVNLEFSATSRKEWRSRASRFNRALVAATSRWSNLMVADWNTHFTPNRVSRFIADGVHLTVNGYRARASFVFNRTKEFGQHIINATTTTIATTTTVSSTTTSTTLEPTTTSPTDSNPPPTIPPAPTSPPNT